MDTVHEGSAVGNAAVPELPEAAGAEDVLMKISSDTVKALCLQYWRYDRGAHIVTLETQGDVGAVLKRFLIETEVKVSIGDLRRDIRKPIHCYLRYFTGMSMDLGYWGNLPQLVNKYSKYISDRQFYFAVPQELENKAVPIIEDMYPYAGLLVAKINSGIGFNDAVRWGSIELVKKSAIFPVPRLNTRCMADMVKAQSATLTRLSLKVGKP